MSGKAHFEVYPERRRFRRPQWRWRLVAANNRIVASSGEGFTRQLDAVRACSTVAETVGSIEWVGPKGYTLVERVES